MTTWEIPDEPDASVTEVTDDYDDQWTRNGSGQWTNGRYELTWGRLLADFGPVYDDND